MTEAAGPPVSFQRLSITVRERPIADAMGRPPIFPPDAAGNVVHFPLAIGATIYHWAAPRPAEAYIAIAHALLEDIATINALSASHDANAQYDYLSQICNAISSAYNCLNTVWYNDPIARACYRKWIAGLPFLVHGSATSSCFAKEMNYGGKFGWFVPDWESAILYSRLTVPTTGDGSPLAMDSGTAPPGGIVPRLTRTLFDHFYPIAAQSTGCFHRIMFAPAVGFTLAVVHNTETDWQTSGASRQYRSLSVDISDHVLNEFWLNFQGRSTCPAGITEFPVLCSLDPTAGPPAAGQTFGPDGSPSPNRDDWFNFRFVRSFAEWNPNVELPAAAGAAEYLPYLREWMAAAVQRSAEDAILDARAFVVYQNFMMAQSNGGLRALQAAQAGATSDVIGQQTARDPNVEATAQAVFAIGGALATSTYGISALVGGAIGGALMIGDAEWIKPVANHGKDDLGRWKPVFDRAWLSGDGSANVDTGPPHFDVSAPPAAAGPTDTGHRVLSLMALATLSPIRGVKDTVEAPQAFTIVIPPPLLTPPPGAPGYVSPVGTEGYVPRPKSSKLGWIAAGLLALGAAWKISTSRKLV